MKRNTVGDFLENVYPEPNTGCWLWGGSYDKAGYGRFRLLGIDKAHRISMFLSDRLNKSLPVLHLCDNPACVNPDHLYQGTQMQNIYDRNIKGRTSKGGSHYRTKFNESDIIRIRGLSGTMSRYKLAKTYGVSPNCIRQIAKRKTWRHVP